MIKPNQYYVIDRGRMENVDCRISNEEFNSFIDQLFQFFNAAVLYQVFHLINGNAAELQQAGYLKTSNSRGLKFGLFISSQMPMNSKMLW